MVKINKDILETTEHPTIDIIIKREECGKVTAFLKLFKRYYLLTKGISIVSIEAIENDFENLREFHTLLNNLYDSVKMTRVRKLKLNFPYMEKFRKKYNIWGNDIHLLYKMILEQHPGIITGYCCECEMDLAYVVHYYFNTVLDESEKAELFFLKSWDLDSIDRWIRKYYKIEEE